MNEKDKNHKKNSKSPPATFRYRTQKLKSRMMKAAAIDNRSIGFAINQAIEDYCSKMGV